MDFLSNLSLGFSVALTPFNLLMATCGVVMGILIGALPGSARRRASRCCCRSPSA
jgi:putative tricarboxylic transport membrane protein